MASIIRTKVNKDNIFLSLKLSFEEMQKLQGKIDNIHIIAEENAITPAGVFERGRKGCTKYLLIPSSLRKGISIGKEAKCMKLELKEKLLWVYFMGIA